MRRFHQRIALVTGAGSGLGVAIAERFAQEGASVVVADHHLSSVTAVAAALEDRGYVASSLGLDLTNNDAMRRTIEYVSARYDHFDVLVNIACIPCIPCIPCSASRDDDDMARWRRLMADYVEGIVGLSLAMLPLLKAATRPVSIVNIASISGLDHDISHAAYAMSKGTVTRMTRSMSLDLAKYGIRVNAVCPSSVKSPVLEGPSASFAAEKVAETKVSAFHLCHIEKPAEVASVVAFLASDDASFVNGVNWQWSGTPVLTPDTGYAHTD